MKWENNMNINFVKMRRFGATVSLQILQGVSMIVLSNTSLSAPRRSRTNGHNSSAMHLYSRTPKRNSGPGIKKIQCSPVGETHDHCLYLFHGANICLFFPTLIGYN